MREWFISELQESLAASAHDVQMVLDYLATRNDLDMSRVGMFTQGSGASIGILTSAVDPRIKVLDALDPWGDWPTWMATSPFVPEEERAEYVKPEFLKKAAALEPIDWLPRVQAKKFRLQDATFELNTPKSRQGEPALGRSPRCNRRYLQNSRRVQRSRTRQEGAGMDPARASVPAGYGSRQFRCTSETVDNFR